MSNLGFALEGAWKVLLAGLLLGAGLPALFALGIRSLAWGAGGDAEVSHARPNPLGTVLGYALFAIVILGVLLGITFIVASGFGKTISFDHIYPTIVDK
ncbi:hypothetical protein Ade02nite_12190 [Paractinoplanes deccanensis]|uniref:Uncharacterized protein n=1 Tax=Paractinoplanes deccanensis TaxID=113561 RepID=A0ABQ3XXW8_9ACTN|nr:hypothetical protein [Actinoplanes deccanensis]GID72578.1 hypothetical protein Ade02nite_12190 [Actinoplanes deccanensis]